MSYDSPISGDAIESMDIIKKLESSIQYHYGELQACMNSVADYNRKAQEYTLSAGKHQEQLRKFEADMIAEIEELRTLLLPKKEELNIDQGCIEIGRSE